MSDADACWVFNKKCIAGAQRHKVITAGFYSSSCWPSLKLHHQLRHVADNNTTTVKSLPVSSTETPTTEFLFTASEERQRREL